MTTRLPRAPGEREDGASDHALVSARAIMVLGTASHVGKSLLTAALCRILSDDGHRVAPFKSQNMSLSSAATPDGLEIGRAQALQAEAARVAPDVRMNPILLKPMGDAVSQVVLLGRVHGVARAAEYHLGRVEEYFPTVTRAYASLAAEHDIIVLEGAGSPAEINLKATDIANLRMAEAANARCLLVGDIDRGGVFASLLGTMELLDPPERARIVAFAINKFRGDAALLASGVAEIERRIGIPCAGVVPWLRDVGLEDEDGVGYDDAPRVRDRAWGRPRGAARALRVAVVRLPLMSNPTDTDALAAEPSVDLAFADRPEDLAHADLVLVPGTKQTLSALAWLRETGFDRALEAVATRAYVVGICGGMQVLGERVRDPEGVEGGGDECGLALLGARTTLVSEKIVRRVRVTPRPHALFGATERVAANGYEIHMGRTILAPGVRAFADVEREGGTALEDGARSADGRVVGTYVHGLFEDDVLRHAVLRALRATRGLAPARAMLPRAAEREARIDRLAAHVRASLDLRAFLA